MQILDKLFSIMYCGNTTMDLVLAPTRRSQGKTPRRTPSMLSGVRLNLKRSGGAVLTVFCSRFLLHSARAEIMGSALVLGTRDLGNESVREE